MTHQVIYHVMSSPKPFLRPLGAGLPLLLYGRNSGVCASLYGCIMDTQGGTLN